MKTLFKFLISQSAFFLVCTSIAQATGPYRDTCDENRTTRVSVRAKFEQCIERKGFSESNQSTDELTMKCSDELAEYNKSIIDLKTCTEKSRFIKNKK